MKHLTLVAAALALSACVSHDFREGQRTSWRCEGGKTFSLRRVGDAVELYASGATHRLYPDGEGRYVAGDVSYTESRGRAALTGVYNGPFENCRRG